MAKFPGGFQPNSKRDFPTNGLKISEPKTAVLGPCLGSPRINPVFGFDLLNLADGQSYIISSCY